MTQAGTWVDRWGKEHAITPADEGIAQAKRDAHSCEGCLPKEGTCPTCDTPFGGCDYCGLDANCVCDSDSPTATECGECGRDTYDPLNK